MDDRDDSMQAWAHQQQLEHRYLCEVVMKYEQWNKCDICGKFIAYDDFDKGAIRELVTYDTEYTPETWETLCKKHADKASTERGN